MSFNQYVNLSSEIIQKLQKGFLGAPVNYLFKDSSGSILRGVLFELTPDNYSKACKRLTGEMTGEISKGDKVYVLPNCRIPLFKLKDYVKSVDAVMTGEIAEATKIIGHDKVIEDVKYQAGGSVMLMSDSSVLRADNFKAFGYGTITQEDIEEQTSRLQSLLDRAEPVCEIPATETILSGAAIQNHVSHHNFSPKYRERFITPTGAQVLYYQILNKIPILSENLIFEKIGKPIALDEESYQSILDMLSSTDENNHKVGAEILANCDIDKSMFYIWRLADKKEWVVGGLSRFKNIRLFIRMSQWHTLARLDEEQAIEYLYDRGLLTKEFFSELFPSVAKKYGDKLESPVVTVNIQPSEKYHEFANGQKISYTKDTLDHEVELIEEEEDDEDTV